MSLNKDLGTGKIIQKTGNGIPEMNSVMMYVVSSLRFSRDY